MIRFDDTGMKVSITPLRSNNIYYVMSTTLDITAVCDWSPICPSMHQPDLWYLAYPDAVAVTLCEQLISGDADIEAYAESTGIL